MLKHLRMYYVLVGLPYVLLLGGSYIFFEPIKRTILNNPIPHLNYAIIVIVLTGGIFILINARRLVRQARYLDQFRAALHDKTDLTTLREIANKYEGALACILQMIASSGDRAISHQEQAALEHELENSRARLVRRNALPQYLTGLLVAMGLLGTFIGLLATLADISVLIGSFADIDMNNIDPIQVFRVMIERMKAPMTSMGIAFSTSMFGLLGSIVIGLMMLGIRRIQGDIFSVLRSEVARPIEIALSFESISFRAGEGGIGSSGEATDLTSKVLLRIEERMAEAARVRQRALSAEIDDFKKQRADMLQALTEQTEANNKFRAELQQLGGQLARIFDSMETSNSQISSQISDLTVNLSGDARESHKLLAQQIEEQKRLKDTLDSYNIEERLAESAQMQQRLLAAQLDDLKQQRIDVVNALTEQTESNNRFRSEVQDLNGRLGDIYASMEKSGAEIREQISELTVHVGADAKEAHRLLNVTSGNIRNELQQLGNQLAGHLNTVVKTSEKGTEELVGQISEMMEQMENEAKGAKEQLGAISSQFRTELQQLGSQLAGHLDTVSNVSEKGSEELASRIAALSSQLENGVQKDQGQREEMLNLLKAQIEAGKGLSGDVQQVGSQLGAVIQVIESGNSAMSGQIAELTRQLVTEDEAAEDGSEQS